MRGVAFSASSVNKRIWGIEVCRLEEGGSTHLLIDGQWAEALMDERSPIIGPRKCGDGQIYALTAGNLSSDASIEVFLKFGGAGGENVAENHPESLKVIFGRVDVLAIEANCPQKPMM